MYFKFHDNLPTSVVRTTFDLYTENVPERTYHSLTGEVCDKSTIINIPAEATHIHAIHFFSTKSSFTYYYPGKGYPLGEGSFLPPLPLLKVGDCYAEGMVVQTGNSILNIDIEEDILPFKGKIISLNEHTVSYVEAELHCRDLWRRKNIKWRMPDLLELADMYYRQEELCKLLQHCGGQPCTLDEYWCQDSSVIELGVTFHMSTGQPAIANKEEQKQTRLIHDY